ncbi:AAA family ATPase [Phocaeicola sp. ICN-14070]|uniref:AAA family ATPase n=1 Tax=Phocaeicola sp. ICN-14070 TaxID=3134656 RepID=UPI0030C0ED55
MENERRTDPSLDMGPEECLLSNILSASQIRATDTYETPPQIIWIDNSTIATLGNFSASTGKAKSKKTFNVSAIVAASLAGKQVLNYRAHLPEGKQRILYVDTEQSRFHCHNVLARILRLAGLPPTTDSENLDFICLREYSPAIRIGVIDYALRQRKGYGLVIIDGIRDLMLDINSTSESVEVINKMMEWSSKYDLHIHCVLHLNKGDNNVRGHIGTEMSNKAETVLVISKNSEQPNISEVHALHIREKEFNPFAFTVNESGLPVLAEGHLSDSLPCAKPKQRTGFMDLTVEQHREALSSAFGDKPIRGFENMLQAMMVAYETIGFKRGRNVMVKLLQYLTDTLKLVVKRDKLFYYDMTPVETMLFEEE